MFSVLLTAGGAIAGLRPRLALAYTRLLLSRAKHPSLQGHARWASRIARLLPFYEYSEERFFDSDGAPAAVAEQRRSGFDRLADDTCVARAPERWRRAAS